MAKLYFFWLNPKLGWIWL